MTTIGSISGVAGVTAAQTGAANPQEAARRTIGEISHRVLAWVGATGGGDHRAAFTLDTGAHSDFTPDGDLLGRGGDIYGIDAMARELSAQFAGSPADEGALRRSLEGFTRETVVQLAGLSGASAERQFSGIRDALAAAGTASVGADLSAITQRLDAATSVLARQNGG